MRFATVLRAAALTVQLSPLVGTVTSNIWRVGANVARCMQSQGFEPRMFDWLVGQRRWAPCRVSLLCSACAKALVLHFASHAIRPVVLKAQALR